MPAENVEDILVLSPTQRLMLIHEFSSSGARTLGGHLRYRVTGKLDAGRLGRAWQSIADRHGALRTCFLWEGLEDPVQVVRARAPLPFQYHDLSGLPGPEQAARVAALEALGRRQGLDLRRAPLLRVELARLDSQTCEMLVTRHHLVLDRWSLDLLFEDLFRAYDLDAPDAVAAWPAAGRFRDYLQWLCSQDAEASQRFWRDSLAGLLEPSLLLGEERRAKTHSAAVAVTELAPDRALSDWLRHCVVTARVAPASVLQAALGLVLAQRTGRRDVVFGLTVSGRPPAVPRVEQCLGSFINSVPARIRFEPGQPVARLLRGIQQAQSERAPHEHLSLAEMRSAGPEAANGALFDTLLLLGSPLTETLAGPSFTMEQLQGPLDSAFPVTVFAGREDAAMRLSAAHDTEAMTRAEARSLLRALREALSRIAAGLDQDVAELIADVPDGDRPLAPAPGTSRVGPAADPVQKIEIADPPAARLRKIWHRVLGSDDVGLDHDFFALGGTSLQAAALFADIEREFGRQLPLSTLFKAGSIRALLQALGEPVARRPRIVAVQPLGSEPPLFVAPGIGGNVVGLYALARALGTARPFYGFEARGLDGLETPHERIEDIAAEYIAEMPPDARSFALCGFCWGSVVAFEMAHQLVAAGRPPDTLVLMDPVMGDWSAGADKQAPRLGAALGLLRDRLQLYRRELKPLGMRERSRWVATKVKGFAQRAIKGETVLDTKVELEQRRVVAAHLAAHAKYRPRGFSGRTAIILTMRPGLETEDDPRLACLAVLPPGTEVLRVAAETTGEAVSRHNAAILAEHITQQLGALPRGLASDPPCPPLSARSV